MYFLLLGTFGQPDPWDIYNPATYHHPMVPYDVLIDPLSLPSHPVVAEKQNMHQIIHEDIANAEAQGVCLSLMFMQVKTLHVFLPQILVTAWFIK